MLWSAALLGLISSTHCLGMCGPLQAAVMGSFASRVQRAQLFAYHASRIFTYGMLGMLAGFIGKGVGIQSWQQQTSLISGLLLLFALIAFYLFKLDRKLLSLLLPYISRIRLKLQRNKSAKYLYFGGSGFINGLLPCGMVYLAIFPAMGMGHPLSSAGFMLLFGLGTMPLLVLTNLGALSFLQRRGKALQRLIPAMLIVTSALLILRGMDLGIPYLSPQLPAEISAADGCK